MTTKAFFWDERAGESGDILPVDSREYALWGFQPPGGNLGQESSFYDSLTSEQLLEWARALYYALTGSEEDGVLTPPGTGHLHDEGADTVMLWQHIGAWPLWTDLGATKAVKRQRIVDETTETPVAFFGFVVPAGNTWVIPRVELNSITASLGVTVHVRFYAPTDLNASPIEGGSLGLLGSAATQFVWREGRPVDLSSVATTDGHRVVFCRVDAKVSGAGTSGVVSVQLVYPETGYRAAQTKIALLTTTAQPNRVLPDADLRALLISTITYLRQVIYGTTYALPRHSRPHDHGEGRGKTLSRHLWSTAYGPHDEEGGAAVVGGTLGLPLLEPASGVSYAGTTPKICVRHACPVPGGVSSVIVRPVAYLPGAGTRTVDLKIEVRPLSDGGYSPAGNQGVVSTLTLTATGANDFQQDDVTLDLAPLGNTHRDRLYEYCVWLVSNPPAASAYRICSSLGYPGTAPTTLPEIATHGPKEDVSHGKIKDGQELSTLLLAKAFRAANQVTKEALGGAPGLDTDLSTPVTTDPWRRLLTDGPHQHRGRYLDVVTGKRVDDGAVIRFPLFCYYYGINLAGGSPEATTGTANPPLGQKLHASGAWDADIISFRARFPVPQGLGAFDVYALIQPGHAARTGRLWTLLTCNAIHKQTEDEEGNYGSSIVTAARSGPFTDTAASSGGYLPVASGLTQVLPEDGAIWQPTRARLSAGLGVWTEDALRPDPPSSTSLLNPARWTQPIRVEIEPVKTVDHQFQIVFGVQTGLEVVPTAGTYAASARLLALFGVPSRGY